MIPFLIFLAIESLLLTLLGSWSIKKIFPKLGLLDRPHKYGLKRKPLPYPGGIIFTVIFIFNILVFMPLTGKYIGFIIAILILASISFFDDRIGISPSIRLFAQIIIAVIIAFSGIGITVISNPLGGSPLILDQFQTTIRLFGYTQTFSLLSCLFTILWIVLFVNTLNWLDGIPGMVSGVSGIGFFVIFLLSLFLSLRANVGQDEIINAQQIAQLAVVGVGMTLAFLFFDFSPPKMIMGDSGSMVLGFIIAVLAIYSGSKIATTFLVLGFPVLDAIIVIIRRIYRKKSPLKGDLGHFHHRLLRVGFSERKTLLTMYFICFVFGILALFIGTQGKFFAIIFMVVLTILIEYLVMRKEKSMMKKEVISQK